MDKYLNNLPLFPYIYCVIVSRFCALSIIPPAAEKQKNKNKKKLCWDLNPLVKSKCKYRSTPRLGR